jgi:membrane protein required for colicin V production
MVLDIIALLLVIMAVYKGWTTGLIMSVFSFFSFFIAITLAFFCSAKVAGYFKASAGSDSKWFSFLAFFAVMLGAIILIRIIGKMVEKVVELMLLGIINKIAGIAVFVFLYFGLMSISLVYLLKYQLLSSEFLQESRVGNYIVPFGNWIVFHFSDWFPEIKNLFNNSKELIQQSGKSLTT